MRRAHLPRWPSSQDRSALTFQALLRATSAMSVSVQACDVEQSGSVDANKSSEADRSPGGAASAERGGGAGGLDLRAANPRNDGWASIPARRWTEEQVKAVAGRRCNCVLVLQNDAGGEARVRAGQWDCPSCGLDKRRSLAEMVKAEACRWLVTATFRQPRAFGSDRQALTPAEFAECDRRTHVYLHTARDGSTSWRWRVMGDCDRCCRRVSKMIELFIKRLRYYHGKALGYLRVYETHKSGALHIHFAVSGLPFALSRPQRARIAGAWKGVGGGFVQCKLPPRRAREAGGMGWYLGKYLAKQQESKMARRRRRWVRSRQFAPEVLMAWSQKARQARAAELGDDQAPAPDRRGGWRIVGWCDPMFGTVCYRRVFLQRADQQVQ